MKKMMISRGIGLSVGLFVLLITLPALAVETETNMPKDNRATVEQRAEQQQQRKETAQVNATERKEEAKSKLAETKLKVCQKREAKINNIMSRTAERGTKQIDVFTKISDRTQAFYTEKGKVLSNYDALVSDVNAKKLAAQSAVDALKQNSVTFKCDGTDPKGVVALFKDSRTAQQNALKEYKTAVKNLIVGVKSVQAPTSESTEGAQ